ncbi:MAG: GFA family protein [Xenococcus sp. (in: cyanobacteria)]
MTLKSKITLPIYGGCQCQKLRYEISVMPLTLYVCHCTECQTQSSSGFGMSMPTPKSGFRLIKGNPKIWSRKSHSGREVQCAFCSECGTRVYHLPSRNKSVVNVKPGTVDDKKMFEPVGNLWVTSAQPWVSISPEAINFPQQPESFEPLYIAWKNRYEQNNLV